MEKVQLWFNPGSWREGARWMSVYKSRKVRLCSQRKCEICDMALKEVLRDFRGGKLDVVLTAHRTPSFFAPEEFYLAHLVSIPTPGITAIDE